MTYLMIVNTGDTNRLSEYFVDHANVLSKHDSVGSSVDECAFLGSTMTGYRKYDLLRWAPVFSGDLRWGMVMNVIELSHANAYVRVTDRAGLWGTLYTLLDVRLAVYRDLVVLYSDGHTWKVR